MKNSCKNRILILAVCSSVILNIYLFFLIIDKNINQHYQEIGLQANANIIKEQEILLNFFGKGMEKKEVLLFLTNILKQQRDTEFFIADKHQNLIVFSDLNFYFFKGKLEKITTEHLDEEFNVAY